MALALAVLSIGLLDTPARATTTADLFEYKFPCRPEDPCYVTQLAHAVDAFDFDPRGSAGLGIIPVVSEGTFSSYVVDQPSCSYYQGTHSLGQYAVINDMFGRTMRYAHLSSFGDLISGTRVLQGDVVGTEGSTGYAQYCVPHLHLEGIASVPGIDGIPLSNIAVSSTPYQSTNSQIGARPGSTNAPAVAIYQLDYLLGATYTSWAAVGWTADWTGNGTEGGCAPGPDPYCQLNVHYAPDPVVGHWGSTQTFRLDPGAPAVDDNAIMVGRWAVYSPFWVTKGYFLRWLFANPKIGLPIAGKIGTSYPYCQGGVIGCIGYQRFHVGYIWQNASGVLPAVFCPDVTPAYPAQDYKVRVNDISAVTQAYHRDDDHYQPYDPWPDSWYDIDGSGYVRINDISVTQAYGKDCYPELP